MEGHRDEAEVKLSSADLLEGYQWPRDAIQQMCQPSSALLHRTLGITHLGVSLIDLVTVSCAVDHTNIQVPSVVW